MSNVIYLENYRTSKEAEWEAEFARCLIDSYSPQTRPLVLAAVLKHLDHPEQVQTLLSNSD